MPVPDGARIVCVAEGLDTIALPCTWLAASVTVDDGAAVTRTSESVRGSVVLSPGTVTELRLFDWSLRVVVAELPTRKLPVPLGALADGVRYALYPVAPVTVAQVMTL